MLIHFVKMAPLVFLFGFLTVFQCLEAASILFFIHVNSYSHRVSVWPLAEDLASRGHQVTFISAHQPKDPNPNITEIVPKTLEKHMYEISKAIFDVTVRVSKSQNNMINDMFDYAYDGCVVLYDSPEFKSWLASKPTVDLVIIDNCVCVECGVGLAYKLNARHMVFSAIPAMPHEYDSFGYTPESSAVPELEVGPPTRPMGFFTRMWNSLMSLRWWFTYNFYYLSKIDKLIRHKLDVGPEMPPIDKIASNVTLVLYTGDAIIEYPRAMPPNHINVAGLHLKELKKPIPKDIESFIGGAEDGFVYISFGSLVNSHRMPNHIKQRFFDVIKSFPRLRFLWKWNGEMEKEIPRNLMLGKWFPQNDLLAHVKIRAFVTQAGRPSSVEAIWNGVPMISFPILGDQDYNANRMEELGVTTKLEIGTVTVEEFKEALQRAAFDAGMKGRVMELQRLFRDRQNTPLETAVWWVEYVLRNPDVSHLRPAGFNQNWFVRRQIDVWAFLTVSIITSAIFIVFIFKRLFHENIKYKKA